MLAYTERLLSMFCKDWRSRKVADEQSTTIKQYSDLDKQLWIHLYNEPLFWKQQVSHSEIWSETYLFMDTEWQVA